MRKRILSLILVLTMCLSLCACNKNTSGNDNGTTAGSQGTSSPTETTTVNNSETTGTTTEAETTTAVDKSAMDYTELSSYIYQEVLGDFYTTYEVAKECDNVAERYALMAVAEAKLLESGVLIPNYTVGGKYAISRVAPYSVDYVLWGSDYERYHQALVCTEFIKAADRAEMKAKWSELRGTGT
ncbi:MAG: peptide ABC transporter substrate-binding protein, partial [Lachnospiraceae bacterium]